MQSLPEPTGIDALTQHYTGYFYRSAPVLMLLVILLAGTAWLAERWSVPRVAAGIAAVLTFPHRAWPAITGILGQAERSGAAVCVADQWWEFMMT